MTMQEIERALGEARGQVANVEREYAAMIRMVAGHLRQATAGHVGNWASNGGALAALKRELADFDIRSKEWKS